jgi:hypothetical protein
MIGTAFLLIAFLCLTSAFEFDLISRDRPLGQKFFASNEVEPLVNKAEAEDPEDNAGFERIPMFGGSSLSGTRRLIQPPPLKRSSLPHRLIRPPPLKRASDPRLIREPPLKRGVFPHDVIYRWPYTMQSATRFAPPIRPIDF